MKIIFIGLILFASASVGDCHYPGTGKLRVPSGDEEAEIREKIEKEPSEIEKLMQIREEIRGKYSPLTSFRICAVAKGYLLNIKTYDTPKSRRNMSEKIEAAMNGQEPKFRNNSPYLKLTTDNHKGGYVLLIVLPKGEEISKKYIILDSNGSPLSYEIFYPFSTIRWGKLKPKDEIKNIRGKE